VTFPKPYQGAPSPVLPATSTAPIALTAEQTVPPARGPPASLADDLLEGAEAIATFMYGDPRLVRSVYRLSTEVSTEHRAPFFKMGNNTLCARKSTLLAWITAKEKAQFQPKNPAAQQP
jgi:hypothetical protein